MMKEKKKRQWLIEFVPLHRDQGSAPHFPDLKRLVNKLQNWASGKVLQISTELTVGSLLDRQP